MEQAIDEVAEAVEETEEEFEQKMTDAMELNAQLRELVKQAEARGSDAIKDLTSGGGRGRGRSGASGSSHTPSGAARRGVPKNGGWGGMTHTSTRTSEIATENAILVQKLSNVALGRATHQSVPGRNVAHRSAGPSSATINRSRADDRIARENAAMAKRLASVKPTAALSKQHAVKSAADHKRRLQNVSRVPPQPGPGYPPRPPLPGANRSSRSLPGAAAGSGRGPPRAAG